MNIEQLLSKITGLFTVKKRHKHNKTQKRGRKYKHKKNKMKGG